MYTIIGGDGKEYGPVPADQVRAWIGGGRANLDTEARFLGAEEWKRLGEFPEFLAGAPPPAIDAGPNLQLADRLLRLGAFLADTVVTMVVALPGALMIGFDALKRLLTEELSGQPSTGPVNAGFFVIVAGLLVLGGVQVWLLTTRGQTVGKWLMKIRIVRFQDGAPPGFVHAVLLRTWLPALISIVPLVGLYFPFFDIGFIFGRQRRCLHDLIADTKVVAA